MTIAENLIVLMANKDINQETLARVAGVSTSAVSRWMNGGQIRSSNLAKICQAFDLTPDDILSSDNGLASKGAFSKIKAHVPTHGNTPAYVPVKSIGRVHAGEPTTPLETDIKTEIPVTVAKRHPQAFVLAVDGTCMDKLVPEGCHVVVDPSLEPANNSVVVCELPDGDVVMRHWIKGNNHLFLTADSFEDYDDIILNPDDGAVKVIGTVVWFQSAKELR